MKTIETLVDAAVRDILRGSPFLAAIGPGIFIEDEEKKEGPWLTVVSTVENKDIDVFFRLRTTIMLRTQGVKVSAAERDKLFFEVRNRLENPPPNLPIYSKFRFLRFEFLDQSSEATVDNTLKDKGFSFTSIAK